MKTSNKHDTFIVNLYIEENDDEPTPVIVPVKNGILAVGKNSVVLPGVSIVPPSNQPLYIGSNSFLGRQSMLAEAESYPKNTIIQGEPLVDAEVVRRPSIMLAGDDFGRTEVNNRCTMALFCKGLLHHASLMVNRGESTLEAVSLVSGTPWFDRIGLHFNATEGTPLSTLSNEKWYSVNNKGSFGMALVGRRTAFFLSCHEKRLLQDELRQQIAQFKSFGFKPTYFDSHGNIHFKRPIAKAIIKILKEEGFEYVRIPRNEKSKHRIYDYLFKRPVIRMYRKAFKTVDKFLNATDLFSSAILEPSDAIYEVMVHPWEKDGQLTNRRDVEFNVIEAFCEAARITILK